MRKVSISDKLIIASLILSVSTILIVASFSFFNAKTAILERTFNQLTSVRVIKTNLIEEFFTNRVNEIKLINTSSDIKKITTQINSLKNKNSDFNLINDSLIGINNKFIDEISKDYFSKITIIGKNNLVYNIKTSNKNADKLDRNYGNILQKIAGDYVVIQDLKKHNNSNEAVITMIANILNSKNKFIGMIVFEIPLKPINSIMLENSPTNGLGTSGESYLVGNDFLMRSQSRFQKNSVLKTEVKTDAVISAFKNELGTKIIKDYRGISVLSSYKKINIQNLNWVILAEIDYKEATVPIYKIQNEIIFISIFIFVIVLIVVIILSKRITYPIIKLNQAAHEIGIGNFNVDVKTKLKDEIGELSESFNKMAYKLKEQNSELKLERSKSLSSVIDGQEAERQRLSRELHDSLGQLLIGLKLKYESFLNKRDIKKSECQDSKFLADLLDKTIDETRRISNNLMPATLSEFGLTTAVRNICNQFSDTSKINIKYETQGNSKKLNDKAKTYIFRIIQEALTNILKHSKAENASINIFFKDKTVILKIEDDGIGFHESNIKTQNTNGLTNIKDRVALLSGKINIKSKLQNGTKIHIEIPIKNEDVSIEM